MPYIQPTVSPTVTLGATNGALFGAFGITPVLGQQTAISFNALKTAANESFNTKGFWLVDDALMAGLYVNIGPVATPNYVTIATAAGALGTANITFRNTGVYAENTLLSTTDSALYWLASASGNTSAFNIKAINTVDSVWGNAGDLVSANFVAVPIPVAVPTTTAISTIAFSADTGSSATDFITNTAAQTISGTTSANLIAGESVQVSLDGGLNWLTATTSVGLNTWSLVTTLVASNTLHVKVIDGVGSGPVSTQAYVLDTVQPAAPTAALAVDTGSSGTDGITSNGQMNVTGVEAGATWQYSTNSGATWSVAQADTVTSFTVAAGTYIIGAIQVRQTDVAGNVTAVASSNAAQIVVDQTAPAAPAATLAVDTGSSATDGITSNGQMNVTGVEAGATWQYSTNSGATWSVAQADTVTSFTVAAGTYIIGAIQVRQTDVAGNVTAVASSNAAQIVVDQTAPAAPTVSLTTDTGAADNISSNVALTVSALAPGDTRSFVINGGTPSVSYVPPTVDGVYTVVVTDTDAAGNVGTPGGSLTFTRDTTATVAIDATLAGDNLVSGVETASFVVTGTTTGVEAGRTVSVTITDTATPTPATFTTTATVLANGTWSAAGVNVQGMRAGTLSITADVSDLSANVATQATASVTLDNNVAPVANNDSGSAIEAGGTANGIAGTDATGNVLANDTDANNILPTPANAGLTVSAITGGTVGVALAGSYGTLTLNTDGSYTYAVDNNNPTVNALQVTSTALNDIFTYTVSDGSLTSNGTLTININGANDAPVIAVSNEVANIGATGTLTSPAQAYLVNGLTLEGDFTWDGGGAVGQSAELLGNGNPNVVLGQIAHFGLGGYNDGAGGFVLYASVGALSWTLSHPANMGAAAILAAGQTVHLGISVIDGQAQVVINGVPFMGTFSAAGVVAADPTPADSLSVGQGAYGVPFSGSIDNISVWTGLRTGVQMAADVNLVGNEPGLTSLWTFDTGFGNAVAGGPALIPAGTTAIVDLNAPATDTTLVVAEDNVLNGTVIASDVDVGAVLSYSNSVAAHGLVSMNSATGVYTYTPDLNYSGPDSFTVTATDLRGLSDTKTINVTVTPVNDAPVAVADTVATAPALGVTEDAVNLDITAAVVQNDSDVDSTFTVTAVNTVGTPGITGGTIYDTTAGAPAGVAGLDTGVAQVLSGVTAVSAFSTTLTEFFSIPTNRTVVAELWQGTVDMAGNFTTVGGVLDTSSSALVSANAINQPVTFNFGPAATGLNAGLVYAIVLVDQSLGGVALTAPTVNDAYAGGALNVGGGAVPADLFGTVVGDTAGTLLSQGTLNVNAGVVTYTAPVSAQAMQVGDSFVDPFTYTITDTGGLTSSAMLDITVNGVNDAPVGTAGGTLAYAELNPAAVIDAGVTLADIDSTQIAGATVTISAGLVNGDLLGFANTLNITGVYNSNTGVLTLSGVDTVANYQAALQSVTFANTTNNPTAGGLSTSRTITWAATDNQGVNALTSAGVTSTINVTTVPDIVSVAVTANDPTINVLPDAPLLAMNSILNGYIERSEQFADHADVFAVNLVAGVAYDINLMDAGSGIDANLAVYAANGQQVAFNDNSIGGTNMGGAFGLDAFIHYTAPTSGTYYLGVADYWGGVGLGYQLSISDATAALSPVVITQEEGMHALWNGYSSTSFSTFVTTGFTGPSSSNPIGYSTTVFTSTTTTTNLSAPSAISSGWLSGGSHFNNTPLTYINSGTISVDVNFDEAVTVDTLGGTPTMDINVNGTIMTASAVAGASVSTVLAAPVLAMNSFVNATLETTEATQDFTDVFQVSLVAGTTYQIDHRGSPSGVGTMSDPNLALYDNVGTRVAYDDDGGTGFESLITFTATYSGTYYIGASTWGQSVGETYQLSIAESTNVAPLVESIITQEETVVVNLGGNGTTLSSSSLLLSSNVVTFTTAAITTQNALNPLVSVVSPIALNGGTILNGALNAPSGLIFAAPDTSTWVIDTLAPVIAADAFQTANGDNLINAVESTAMFLSGTTNAEDGQAVTVTLSDGVNAPVVTIAVANGGVWTSVPFDASSLQDGLNNITLTATTTDRAGNPSAASAPVLIGKDTVAPTLAIDATLMGDNFVSTAEATAVVISGTSDAENGQTVSVTLTDTTAPTANTTTLLATVSGGVWSTSATPFNMSTWASGNISIAASVTDLAGNPASASSAIILDQTPPVAQYHAVTYDPNTLTFTLTGTGMDSLLSFGGMLDDGTGTVGTNLANQLDFTKMLWNVEDNFGSTPFALNDGFTNHVQSAFVTDANTLRVTTDGNVGFEFNPERGTYGSGVFDTVTINTGFSVDPVGNASTTDGTFGGLYALGTLNEAGMPKTFTVDFTTGVGSIQDQTIGRDAGQQTSFDVTAGDTLTVSGVSAAQLDVFGAVSYSNFFFDPTQLGLMVSTHFDAGVTPFSASLATVALGITDSSGASFPFTVFGSMDNTSVQFADGSKLLTHFDFGFAPFFFGPVLSATLNGGAGNDQLIASYTNDRLLGNAGDDLLIGGSGNNQMYGGTGNDILFGMGGNDFLNGGSGIDTFIYTINDGSTGFATQDGRDTIQSFTAGVGGDVIDLADNVLNNFITFDMGGNVVADANIFQSGADTLLVLNSLESVRLLGVTVNTLTTDNFANNMFYLDGGSAIDSGFVPV
ncbi:MAG: beta strand repeat-containing protein [Pseudomonadota bacterium]